MKKIIGLIVVLTTVLLFVTKSLYVEGTELFIIIGSLSVITIMFNLFLKQEIRYSAIAGISAFIGFLFFWVFGLIDLIVDHFMYYLPTGNEDGMALTLGMKIDEFSDDLFVASFISMISVLMISFLASLILKLITKSHKIDI
jgi:hypothetical protein